MRVGSSFSRLKKNTPEVNGKEPGRFSRMRHFRISPWSSKPGSATFGSFVPEREIELSRVRISFLRTLTTCSSGVNLLRLRPVFNQLPGARVELGVFLFDERIQRRGVTACGG